MYGKAFSIYLLQVARENGFEKLSHNNAPLSGYREISVMFLLMRCRQF